jgi:hypothetical protein
MTKRIAIAVICASAMLAAGGNAFAKNHPSNCAPNCTPNSVGNQPTTVSAPEIDAGAGTSAIALLITGILIAAERRRRV